MARYHTPPGDGLEPIVREFQKDRRQLREQARPDADQIGETLRRIQEQQAYQASLVTRAVDGTTQTFSNVAGTGVANHVDTGLEITLMIPTGRAIVTVSSGLVYVAPGNSAAEGIVTFSISTPSSPDWWPAGTRMLRVWASGGIASGAGGGDASIVTTPTTSAQTFRLYTGYRSYSSTSLATIQINAPSLSVQVIDPEPN